MHLKRFPSKVLRPGLLLLNMVKCKRKEGFREELISNKTVEFDDLGKFWTFQTCKEVKKQIYHPGPYSEEKAQKEVVVAFCSCLRQNIHPHRGLLKRLFMWFVGLLSHLNRGWKQRKDYPGKTCGRVSCLKE